MEEHPILFNGEMVRGLLADRKTGTRRVIKPQPNKLLRKVLSLSKLLDIFWTHKGLDKDVKCPYGKVGDRLWVRETYVVESNLGLQEPDYKPPFDDARPVKWEADEYGEKIIWNQCHYRATDPQPELAYEDKEEPCCKWRPSIFMPRWASRITLEITEIRVERVQDITEEDAQAEGCEADYSEDFSCGSLAEMENRENGYTPEFGYYYGFKALWDSINAKRGYPWEKNPYVWVVNFKRITP